MYTIYIHAYIFMYMHMPCNIDEWLTSAPTSQTPSMYALRATRRIRANTATYNSWNQRTHCNTLQHAATHGSWNQKTYSSSLRYQLLKSCIRMSHIKRMNVWRVERKRWNQRTHLSSKRRVCKSSVHTWICATLQHTAKHCNSQSKDVFELNAAVVVEVVVFQTRIRWH